MNISTTNVLPGAPPSAPTAKPVSLQDQADKIDFSHLLKELDLDGDGRISDHEFDVYRSAKTAKGEFVAADGPGGENPGQAAGDVTETLFREVMENRRSDS